MKIKIGLIGCGAIGSEIAKAIDIRFKKVATLTAVSDIDEKKARALIGRLRIKAKHSSIDDLIKKTDLVVEAASAQVSGEVAKKVILAGKDIMIMSVGGIIKDYAALFNLASRKGCKIYIPSGAICGLDGVKAASLGRIYNAWLITRKPPLGLTGAPYLKGHNIDLNKIRAETVVFEGNAQEAIKGFPANINVACALSIAGIGPKKTRVKIITSPEYKENVHEVSIEGEFGRMVSRTENVPSPSNPKTSLLAAFSAIAMLKQILGPVRIGT